MADVTDLFYAGDAFIGYGAQIKVGQGDSPETFTAVADIMEITFGDMTTNVIPKTHLRSPGRHHEKIATIRDSGPISIKGNYRPGHGSQSHATPVDGFLAGRSLLELWESVTEANFIIELPDGSPATELPFRGVVTKFQPGTVGLETLVDFTCEITPLQSYSEDLP